MVELSVMTSVYRYALFLQKTVNTILNDIFVYFRFIIFLSSTNLDTLIDFEKKAKEIKKVRYRFIIQNLKTKYMNETIYFFNIKPLPIKLIFSKEKGINERC